MPHNRKLVAYHEAGHAVMALHLGDEVVSVRIQPDDEDRPGLTETTGKRKSIEEQALCLLAGGRAEMLAQPGSQEVSVLARKDEQCLVNLLHDHLHSQEFEGDTLDKAYEATGPLAEKATQLLKRHWQVVVAIADALIARPELSGAQAQKFYDQFCPEA